MNSNLVMQLKRTHVLVGMGTLVLFLVAPPLLPRWVLFLLTVAWAKAMVVLGIVLLLRGDLVSFGHGMYFAAGAYAAGFGMKVLGVHEGLTLVAFGAVAGAALAALLGLLLARYRAIFFALLNMAFSMVIYGILLKFYSVTGGTDGISIRLPTLASMMPPLAHVRLFYYYLTLGLGIISIYVAHRFAASPLGYTLRAISSNEVRVEYMGASVRRAIYLTYILTGMLAGLGGVLTAFAVGHVVPEYSFWTQSAEFVFVALLGGTGSIFAPVIGSIIFEFVRNYAFEFSPYTWQMSLGIVLLLIILFLPGGLWSIIEPFAQKRNSK